MSDVRQLWPGAVIPDEAIPTLLRRVRRPTFVTLNATDFWRRLIPEEAFFVACFDIPDSDAREIAGLLRRLLKLPEFKTWKSRRGKVALINPRRLQFYSKASWAVRRIKW